MERLPTPVFWHGKSMGLQRVGHDWATFTLWELFYGPACGLCAMYISCYLKGMCILQEFSIIVLKYQLGQFVDSVAWIFYILTDVSIIFLPTEGGVKIFNITNNFKLINLTTYMKVTNSLRITTQWKGYKKDIKKSEWSLNLKKKYLQ